MVFCAILQFPDRVETYHVSVNDGNHTGIFSIDLTFDEIKSLRAKVGCFANTACHIALLMVMNLVVTTPESSLWCL